MAEPEEGEGEKVCTTRALYRAGKKETAVKAYSVTKESRYLLIKNVPQLGTTSELLKQLSLYGQIEEWKHLDDVDTPEYTEAYWVKFKYIGDARFCKRKMDDHEFYHNLLDISYVLEDETEDDVLFKLEERRRAVMNKVTGRKRKIIENDFEDEVPPWQQLLDPKEFPDMGPTSSSSSSSSTTPNNNIYGKGKERLKGDDVGLGNSSVSSSVENIRNKLKLKAAAPKKK